MHRLTVAGVLILGLALSAGTGEAQTPTLASAHQFVSMKLGNGVAEFSLNDDEGNLNDNWATITSLTTSECTTHLNGRDENGSFMSRTIPWNTVTAVYSITGGRDGVELQGAIRMTTGKLTPVLLVSVESWDTEQRLIKAMQFIMQACDTSKGTGF